MAQQTDISKMETTQTAVEWLVEQEVSIDLGGGIRMKVPISQDIIEQAKQMEKEQIIKAHNLGVITPYTNLYTIPIQVQGKELITKGEQHYNETYGK